MACVVATTTMQTNPCSNSIYTLKFNLLSNRPKSYKTFNANTPSSRVFEEYQKQKMPPLAL